MKCRDLSHEIVKEEVEGAVEAVDWKATMERSFERMDKEVGHWSGPLKSSSTCRCDIQTQQCDAVGSTAVVAVVTPEKIIVSNCGDSRAVLCRNGVAVPLSSDHKVRKIIEKRPDLFCVDFENFQDLGPIFVRFICFCVRDLNRRGLVLPLVH
jgi:hypothetical protein